jgi:DNA-binding Xre family transcriptional regulator
MIKNEKQYKITKAWLAKFEQGKEESVQLPVSKTQPWLHKAQKGSLDLQIKQFKDELKEYEGLKSGKIKAPGLDVLNSLPELLIKKRIANGWTLEQLAERLGLHHQQIQRYESTDYATATLETMQKIAIALNSEQITIKTKVSSSRRRPRKRANA